MNYLKDFHNVKVYVVESIPKMNVKIRKVRVYASGTTKHVRQKVMINVPIKVKINV